MSWGGLAELLCCASLEDAPSASACLWRALTEKVCGEAEKPNQLHEPRKQSDPWNDELQGAKFTPRTHLPASEPAITSVQTTQVHFHADLPFPQSFILT